MYKLLLCWRYLRTRYIALICIVSIMLGVATLIVTNGVMAGFFSRNADSDEWDDGGRDRGISLYEWSIWS